MSFLAAHRDRSVTTRILSISGLRGIIGDGLDPIYVTVMAQPGLGGPGGCGGLISIYAGGRLLHVESAQSVGADDPAPEGARNTGS